MLAIYFLCGLDWPWRRAECPITKLQTIMALGDTQAYLWLYFAHLVNYNLERVVRVDFVTELAALRIV